jgi:hypothetical protein
MAPPRSGLVSFRLTVHDMICMLNLQPLSVLLLLPACNCMQCLPDPHLLNSSLPKKQKRGSVSCQNSESESDGSRKVKINISVSTFLSLDRADNSPCLPCAWAWPQAINHSWVRVGVQGGRGACGQPIYNWFGLPWQQEANHLRHTQTP